MIPGQGLISCPVFVDVVVQRGELAAQFLEGAPIAAEGVAIVASLFEQGSEAAIAP